MCLTLRAVPDRESQVSARRLSAISGLHIRKVNGSFEIAREPGCGCSMAVEGKQWPLDDRAIERLATALALLGRFAFLAVLADETATSERSVKLPTFLRTLREGAIERGCTYRVR